MTDPMNTARPLAAGSQLTVAIRDIAFGGEGVARLDDFVIFVPFVLTGEEARVEIIEVKRKFARARLLEVLKASADRVQSHAIRRNFQRRRNSRAASDSRSATLRRNKHFASAG